MMKRREFLRSVYQGALAAGYVSAFGLPDGSVAAPAEPWCNSAFVSHLAEKFGVPHSHFGQVFTTLQEASKHVKPGGTIYVDSRHMERVDLTKGNAVTFPSNTVTVGSKQDKGLWLEMEYDDAS